MFCTATETVSDLENQALCEHAPLRTHKLDDRETTVFDAEAPRLDPTLDPFPHDPVLLLINSQLLVQVDVFVDNLLGLDQFLTHHSHHVHHTLFHELEKVLRLLYNLDPTHIK